jgi:hypothetical protein
MPIFKVQKDIDKTYLTKKYWQMDDTKIWDKDGHIFDKIHELRRIQNRISMLQMSSSLYNATLFYLIRYDLENMTKSHVVLNRVHIDNLQIGDRIRLSFCDFLSLTQMKRLLKSGFVPGQLYEVQWKKAGYDWGQGSILKNVNLTYDLIELLGYPGLKLPYCLFSQF